MEQNPKVTNIAINGSAGALTQINGTILASRVEVMEDPAYNAGAQQGLQGFYLDPNSNPANPAKSPANAQVWLPNGTGGSGRAYQPIIFGGAPGRVFAAFGQYASADTTPLLQVKSLSASAGGVLLVEWP